MMTTALEDQTYGNQKIKKGDPFDVRQEDFALLSLLGRISPADGPEFGKKIMVPEAPEVKTGKTYKTRRI